MKRFKVFGTAFTSAVDSFYLKDIDFLLEDRNLARLCSCLISKLIVDTQEFLSSTLGHKIRSFETESSSFLLPEPESPYIKVWIKYSLL